MTRQPAAPLIDPLLSVVMPVYNERETLAEIVRRIYRETLEGRSALAIVEVSEP